MVTRRCWRAGKHYVTVFVQARVPRGSEARRLEPKKCLGWYWVNVDDIGRGKQAGKVFLPLQALVDTCASEGHEPLRSLLCLESASRAASTT